MDNVNTCNSKFSDLTSEAVAFYWLTSSNAWFWYKTLQLERKECACEPRHDKTNKMSVRPAKTQIRLGGSAWASVQSDQSLRPALTGYLRTQSFFMRTAKTDQTGQMPRLIWVFAGRTFILLVLSEHTAKTRISLGIRPVWSESLPCA